MSNMFTSIKGNSDVALKEPLPSQQEAAPELWKSAISRSVAKDLPLNRNPFSLWLKTVRHSSRDATHPSAAICVISQSRLFHIEMQRMGDAHT